MAGWLQKFLSSSPGKTGAALVKKTQLPAKGGARSMIQYQTQDPPAGHAVLPPASIVYGAAAGVLVAAAIALMIAGSWISGLLVLLPAACFVGYALHFIRRQ